MPKFDADKAVIFSVIGLLAWAVVGLPLLGAFDRPIQSPSESKTARYYASQEPTAEEPWLTKDAAGFFTFWLFVIGGFQLGLFYWQLRYMRKGMEDTATAANSARSAADTASQQLELSRKALIATERSFVYCERIKSHWIAKKETEEIMEWVFTPIWKNGGSTPTKRATSNVNFWIGTNAGPLPKDFDFPDHAPARPTMIAPQANMHMMALHIPIATLQAMRGGTAHAYVWGWCDYDSIIPDSPRHRAEFCCEIEVTANPIYKEGGFAYRMHGLFNGFDEDCMREPAPYKPAS